MSDERRRFSIDLPVSESDEPSVGRRLVNWFLIGGSRRLVAVALLVAERTVTAGAFTIE